MKPYIRSFRIGAPIGEIREYVAGVGFNGLALPRSGIEVCVGKATRIARGQEGTIGIVARIGLRTDRPFRRSRIA